MQIFAMRSWQHSSFIASARGAVWAALVSTGVLAQAPLPLGDIAVGSASGRVGAFAGGYGHGQLVLFLADDGQGSEPWVTDGSTAGTLRLRDLQVGPSSSSPRGFAGLGGSVVFAAWQSGIGEELAVTDGTAAGTVPLGDLRPGLANSNPHQLLRFGDEVLFLADDGNGERVFRTDGSIAGTMPHPVLPRHFRNGCVVGGAVYWLRDAGASDELWRWNGRTAPNAVASIARAGSVSARGLTAFGDRVVFVRYAANSRFSSFWISDGTPGSTQQWTRSYLSLGRPAIVEDRFYFTTRTGGGDAELLVTGGTRIGEVSVVRFEGDIEGLCPVGSRLCFVASEVVFQQRQVRLELVDRSRTVTTLIADGIRPLAVGEDRIVFFREDAANGLELWGSDLTSAGTARWTDLAVGPASSFDASSAPGVFGGRLYFWADDGVRGFEPYSLALGASSLPVGTGCAVAAPLRLRSNDPVLGGSVVFSGSAARGQAPGFVALGVPARVPLRASPSCDLLLDVGGPVSVLPFATDASGRFQLAGLPVPAVPSLRGARFIAQAVVATPGGPLSGVDLSSGLLLHLGN